jgi:hypothetical protein
MEGSGCSRIEVYPGICLNEQLRKTSQESLCLGLDLSQLARYLIIDLIYRLCLFLCVNLYFHSDIRYTET